MRDEPVPMPSYSVFVRLLRTIAAGFLAACLVAACSDGDNNRSQTAADSSVVVEQEISWLNNGERDVGYTIDAIPFTLQSDSTVTVDVLSVGAYTPALDTQVYLARDDGSLDTGDLVYTNDDGELGADGSTQELDSYLRAELQAGDYIVFVGDCCFGAEQALAGYRLVTGDDPRAELAVGNVKGGYRVTISGNVAARN